MYRFQTAYGGVNWEEIEPIGKQKEFFTQEEAEDAFYEGNFWSLIGFEPEGKYNIRLVNDEDEVIEEWASMPYHGKPYIAMLGKNPFVDFQETYDFTDNEMINFCVKYLEHKGYYHHVTKTSWKD